MATYYQINRLCRLILCVQQPPKIFFHIPAYDQNESKIVIIKNLYGSILQVK